MIPRDESIAGMIAASIVMGINSYHSLFIHIVAKQRARQLLKDHLKTEYEILKELRAVPRENMQEDKGPEQTLDQYIALWMKKLDEHYEECSHHCDEIPEDSILSEDILDEI